MVKGHVCNIYGPRLQVVGFWHLKMVDKRLLLGFSSVYFLLFVVSEVNGTLTPSGPVPVDCGSQQTFICNVPGTGAAAGWTVSGLNGIMFVENSGRAAAGTFARINTSDTMAFMPSSTINITGFTTADNGGTVQCVNLNDNGAVQGTATVSVGRPSSPTITSSNRSADFTSANVTWLQLQPPNSPPVTTTTVTYCPTSSPNCGNSTTCTSPCTISGLDPCVNYSVTVTPNNNCGSATGSMMNMIDSPSQGEPLCPENVTASLAGSAVDITWARNSTSPLDTSAQVYYCTVSSLECTRKQCNFPQCRLEGLRTNTNFSFTVLPINKCGQPAPNECIGIQDFLVIPEHSNNIVVIVVVVVVVVIILVVIGTSIAIIVICCCCSAVFTCFVATCCCCCTSAGKDRSKSNKLEPSGGVYADPQDVRDKKAKNEEKGITYAALEFSEQAGNTGGQNMRSKDQPVQYMAVEHA